MSVEVRIPQIGFSTQEGTLVDTFKAAGVTVITPDVNAFKAPVVAKVPKMF